MRCLPISSFIRQKISILTDDHHRVKMIPAGNLIAESNNSNYFTFCARTGGTFLEQEGKWAGASEFVVAAGNFEIRHPQQCSTFARRTKRRGGFESIRLPFFLFRCVWHAPSHFRFLSLAHFSFHRQSSSVHCVLSAGAGWRGWW